MNYDGIEITISDLLGLYKMVRSKTKRKEHTTLTGLMFPAVDLVKAQKVR